MSTPAPRDCGGPGLVTVRPGRAQRPADPVVCLPTQSGVARVHRETTWADCHPAPKLGRIEPDTAFLDPHWSACSLRYLTQVNPNRRAHEDRLRTSVGHRPLVRRQDGALVPVGRDLPGGCWPTKPARGLPSICDRRGHWHTADPGPVTGTSRWHQESLVSQPEVLTERSVGCSLKLRGPSSERWTISMKGGW